jgi:hypothetical protein
VEEDDSGANSATAAIPHGSVAAVAVVVVVRVGPNGDSHNQTNLGIVRKAVVAPVVENIFDQPKEE